MPQNLGKRSKSQTFMPQNLGKRSKSQTFMSQNPLFWTFDSQTFMTHSFIPALIFVLKVFAQVNDVCF